MTQTVEGLARVITNPNSIITAKSIIHPSMSMFLMAAEQTARMYGQARAIDGEDPRHSL
jgi:hypothetical protein